MCVCLLLWASHEGILQGNPVWLLLFVVHIKESSKGSLFVCLLLLCASHQRILQGKPVSLFVVVVWFTSKNPPREACLFVCCCCVLHMKESSKGCLYWCKKLSYSIECPMEWYISHRFPPPQLHVVVGCCCVMMCVPMHAILWTLPAT